MKKWRTKNGYEIIQLLSGRSNVFLLSNGNSNILIDTSVNRLWTKLQKQLRKLKIDTIDYLVLTHAHYDHAGNASRIRGKFNCKVVIQKNEYSYLSNGDNIIPNGTNLFTKLVINLLGRRLFHRFKYAPCKPDLIIDNDFDLNVLGFNAYLLHTPGHTSGSMSLIIDDEIAVVGDTLFGVFGWSVFPPYAKDKDLLIKSWGKLLGTRCSTFLPSHGTENSRTFVEKDYNKRIRKLRFATG